MTPTTYLTPHQTRQRRAAERRPLDRAVAEPDAAVVSSAPSWVDDRCPECGSQTAHASWCSEIAAAEADLFDALAAVGCTLEPLVTDQEVTP